MTVKNLNDKKYFMNKCSMKFFIKKKTFLLHHQKHQFYLQLITNKSINHLKLILSRPLNSNERKFIREKVGGNEVKLELH